MKLFRLRNILPRSLLGRAILILVVPIIVIQLVVGIIFLDRLFGDVTYNQTGEVANQINYILGLPPAEQAKAASELNIDIEPMPANELSRTGEYLRFYDLSGHYVFEELNTQLENITFIDLLSESNRVTLGLIKDGAAYQIEFDRIRASAKNPHQLLVAMTAASLLMTLLALIFLRNQIKPIRLLARSAEAFGKGRNIPYHPRGAAEVRVAGAAFQAMKARIERHLEQRTMMLSGVSHDLRTPLTRMKLSLSLLDDDDEIEDMKRDVDEMEGILNEFLAFTRGDQDETRVWVDPIEMAQTIANNHERSGRTVPVTIHSTVDHDIKINCRDTALARAINNLITNAHRYADNAAITVEIQKKTISFIIEDDGPGIPEDARETALRPFTRLDTARNQNKGSGTGLGLTITADIVRSHGGRLILGSSAAMGGLRAEIHLPR